MPRIVSTLLAMAIGDFPSRIKPSRPPAENLARVLRLTEQRLWLTEDTLWLTEELLQQPFQRASVVALGLRLAKDLLRLTKDSPHQRDASAAFSTKLYFGTEPLAKQRPFR